MSSFARQGKAEFSDTKGRLREYARNNEFVTSCCSTRVGGTTWRQPETSTFARWGEWGGGGVVRSLFIVNAPHYGNHFTRGNALERQNIHPFAALQSPFYAHLPRLFPSPSLFSFHFSLFSFLSFFFFAFRFFPSVFYHSGWWNKEVPRSLVQGGKI